MEELHELFKASFEQYKESTRATIEELREADKKKNAAFNSSLLEIRSLSFNITLLNKELDNIYRDNEILESKLKTALEQIAALQSNKTVLGLPG